MPRSCSVLLVILLAGSVFADPASDAAKLKEEAVDILKANASRNATPEQYADCIMKLEKAQALLEGAGDTESALAQEVSSSLFWARRFSDVNVIKALDKLRGGAPPPPPVKKPDPPKPKEPAKPVDPDGPDGPDAAPVENLAEIKAKAAFEAADKYAKNNAKDDYIVALRWFQMANEHPGTDYALKALELARAAQARYAEKNKLVQDEVLPDTPEMKMVKEADGLAALGKYEESFALYQSSIKLKETIVAHRRLAKAYLKRGQQLKDEILPKVEASVAEFNKQKRAAYERRQTRAGRTYWRFNPNYPPYVEAVRKNQEACKEALKAIEYYDKAAVEYKAVLRMAPGGKDLDAAGHIGVCMSVRGDQSARMNAKTYLLKFLDEYSPSNDLERSLYEFCKTELNRISGKKG
ncbi:MAG TPA: hypothetical protein VEJ63_11130 [Planctomycetota bacterium]|nr:hypothetical protein [Planctomycetota bacterium]